MKSILILLSLLIVADGFSQQNKSGDRLEVILAVRKIFEGTDERNWDKVKESMAPELYLDFSSMSGKPGSTMKSSDIIDSWKQFIPGFDSTHHALARFQTVIKDNEARVHYFGKADHFLGENSWIVEGTYDTMLEKRGGNWMIVRHKFTVDQQRGDTTLPAKAIEIAKSKQ